MITLIEFFFDWCSACKKQEPILEELKKVMGDNVDIIKINLADSEFESMIDEFKIYSTPTILILKDNNLMKRFEGLTSIDELNSIILNG